MIRQNKEKRIEVREHVFDGEGEITVRRFDTLYLTNRSD